ncbi:hypothetical protein NKH37_28780 [Mesorhizobium sp. M1217]|uniref:hypothetical protein n=1 Tax=Mesorhizobium sp. M1217 TaxID=2957070 RepID=UPI0033390AE8
MNQEVRHISKEARRVDQQAARRAGAATRKPKCPIVMFDGQIADLADMQAGQIDFAHIAGALSKTARFTGRHRGGAISVAQHCVMGADALFRESGDGVLAGYFLLHDAHEYLLGDIGRPAVLDIDLKTAEYLIEKGVPAAIAHGAVAEGTKRSKRALDIPIIEAAQLPPISRMPLYARQVAEMDERMCMAEARALYGAKGDFPLVRCDLPPPRLTGTIEPWGAMKAEIAFLDRLERYLGIVVRAA